MTARRTELRDRIENTSTALALGGVAAHLALTAVDNLPDLHISIRRVTTAVGEIPTWKFFGPNPGVDDIHLFYRRALENRPTSEWIEIDLRVKRPWWAPLWNPGTRGPKALFDATQQVKRAAAQLNGDFDLLVNTPGYRLLEDYVRSIIPAPTPFDQAQFLLITSRPMPHESEAQPVMASPFFEITPHDRYGG